MFLTTARALLAISTLFCALPSMADGRLPISFVLDWKLQGVHSWYYLAEDRGYFDRENIELNIDQGDGSAATVTKIMAGTYQAGFGDVNAIIQNAARRPERTPVMVYMVYNRAPFAIMTLADGPIHRLKDLQGARLGSPAGGAAMRMFDTLARLNNLDADSVEWVNMAPNLQEQMLLRGDVDASAVFSVTSYVNLLAQGKDPEQDVRWFHYADHGVALYGNGVMVSPELIEQHPQTVRGLVRAINHGIRDAIADPDAAIEALAKREPLINKTLEKQRLLYTLKTVMLTPEVSDNGLGQTDPERLARSIEQVADVFELPARPSASRVFTDEFLPPRAQRQAAQ
ncbi:hypothetical protein Q668_14600 [Alcanivorax sp. PN-3]|nr:hypothetical protein Q668_14600 [Alcanivorax sp. PN-3]